MKRKLLATILIALVLSLGIEVSTPTKEITGNVLDYDVVISAGATISGFTINIGTGQLILKDGVVAYDLVVIADTENMPYGKPVISIEGKVRLTNVEIDGTASGEYCGETHGGNALGFTDAADGTEITKLYAHDIAQSGVDNWHVSEQRYRSNLGNIKITDSVFENINSEDAIALSCYDSEIMFNTFINVCEQAIVIGSNQASHKVENNHIAYIICDNVGAALFFTYDAASGFTVPRYCTAEHIMIRNGLYGDHIPVPTASIWIMGEYNTLSDYVILDEERTTWGMGVAVEGKGHKVSDGTILVGAEGADTVGLWVGYQKTQAGAEDIMITNHHIVAGRPVIAEGMTEDYINNLLLTNITGHGSFRDAMNLTRIDGGIVDNCIVDAAEGYASLKVREADMILGNNLFYNGINQ